MESRMMAVVALAKLNSYIRVRLRYKQQLVQVYVFSLVQKEITQYIKALQLLSKEKTVMITIKSQMMDVLHSVTLILGGYVRMELMWLLTLAQRSVEMDQTIINILVMMGILLTEMDVIQLVKSRVQTGVANMVTSRSQIFVLQYVQ